MAEGYLATGALVYSRRVSGMQGPNKKGPMSGVWGSPPVASCRTPCTSAATALRGPEVCLQSCTWTLSVR